MNEEKIKISPLAPASFPPMPEIRGVRLATAATGMKYQDRDDLLCVMLAKDTVAAGVLTRSRTASAPVELCRANLARGKAARGLLINAGNANAFTGKAGDDAMTSTVMNLAERLGCAADQIYISSTGVIGEVLEADKINAQLSTLFDDLSGDHWQAAARAIRTTDTFAKGATASITINGTEVTINGIAKGSGMITPDMATMLAYIFTDAKIPRKLLQDMVADCADQTFNCITVDSDTSTSDTLLAFATGQVEITDYDRFKAAMCAVMTDLAHQIVRDGEGASKFIEITVTGAEDARAAKVIALSIANSPLVKTAIAGEDANWGRIVMAVGKAGERAERDALKITIGGVRVTEHGTAAAGYDEAKCTAHLKGREIDIVVDVGVAQGENAGEATVWTCDLTYGYIDINADYRS